MQRRTRIKFCGITRPEDAIKAVELGVDAIGLMFYPDSPRYVRIARAQAIARVVPAFVDIVAVFVDAAQNDIAETLAQVPVDVLQYHGDETASDCERFAKPYIKCLRMRSGVDVVKAAASYKTSRALLLDTFSHAEKGGTGKTFAWSMIPKDFTQPYVLAGGLDASNIAHAIQLLRPYAVDVSGGIESAKGIKDHAKMAAFMQEARHADET